MISPLDHEKVGVSVLLKGDRGAESGEAGPDDQHADMVGAGWMRVHQIAVPVFAGSGVAETPAVVEFSM